jgi:hypothetical protein
MERGLIIPVALTMVVSGIGLIIAENLDFFGNPWLVAGIVLHLIALGIAVLNPSPHFSNTLRMRDRRSTRQKRA